MDIFDYNFFIFDAALLYGFLLLPGILRIRRLKGPGFFVTVLMIVLNFTGYKLITNFFTASYFYSSMATDFMGTFKNEGLFAGCLFLLNKIYDKWILIRWEMSLGAQQGLTDGQIYFACCIAMLLLFIWLLFDLLKIRHKKKIRMEI